MNTPTHLIMTAAARKALPNLRIPLSAALVGSIAPDLPLYALTFGGLFYYTRILGWPLRDAARHIFDYLYFQDPGWIACHNLLHSPTSLAILLTITVWRLRKHPAGRANWWFWFLVSCSLHSFVDILTHYDDGPVLFWPFDWTLRFPSVSYWDPNHSGALVSKIELAIVVACLGYLAWPILSRPFRRGAEESA